MIRALLALALVAGTGGAGRAAEAAEPAAPFEVEAHADLAYYAGADADPDRHKLDLYVPKGAKDFPVLIFVHGGTWRSGSKSLYVPLGTTFAKAGIVTAVVNYRLSPKVKHPAHVEDVARAFDWVVRNVGKYGGRADRVFLAGHSAGGHLVSLLALDDAYLKAVGRSPRDVRGVLAVSGVYTIPSEFPVLHPIFGADEAACKRASPLVHVSGKHPPFLIAYAEEELPGLGPNARDMYAALQKASCEATLCEIKDRGHISIIVGTVAAGDPLTVAMRDFVAARAK